jgi:prepilin-type processing-associated H-X9-DG protein
MQGGSALRVAISCLVTYRRAVLLGNFGMFDGHVHCSLSFSMSLYIRNWGKLERASEAF